MSGKLLTLDCGLEGVVRVMEDKRLSFKGTVIFFSLQ